MTPQQIRDAITARPALQALAEARDWVALADAFNALELRTPSPERIDAAKIMARLSNEDSATLFGTLVAAAVQSPLVAEALVQIRGAGIDLSHENATDMIGQLFPGALGERIAALGTALVTLTAAEAEALIGLQPVTTWTGEVVSTTSVRGMVSVQVRYVSSDPDAQPIMADPIFGDSVTPGYVAAVIAARCESLQKADAALALFGG